MILKKQEKSGIIKAIYSSSTLCASIFDTNTRSLTVIFNNGGQYKYPSVDLTDYTRFETADSNGSVFSTYIKKKYTNFEKLDKLDADTIDTILKEVSELKEAEDKSNLEGIKKIMMESMATLLANYVKTNNIDYDLFRKIETNMTKYDGIQNPQPTQKNSDEV